MARRKAVRDQAVVSHYLEHVSVAALSRYRQEITDLIQDHRGVYALYQNDQLYSVGLTSALGQRVPEHLEAHQAGHWNYFSLYLVQDAHSVSGIDELVMRIADPSSRQQRSRLPHASDMRELLKDNMMRREEAKVKGLLGTGEEPAAGVKRDGAARLRRSSRRLKGLIQGQKRIYANYKGQVYHAMLCEQGRIKLKGRLYDSPSGAGRAITQRKTDGWAFWKILHHGQLVRLKDL